MLIFSNPLGVREFDGIATLIHPDDDVSARESHLKLVHRLHRSVSHGERRSFSCYRWHSDVPRGWKVTDLIDPFPTPTRDARTKPRGRFKLPFRL
jgi:hypothetical protein